MIFFSLTTAFASTIFGLDHQPLNRSDLTWIEQDRLSTHLLAEQDRSLSLPSFWIAQETKQLRYQLGISTWIRSTRSSSEVDSRTIVGAIRVESDCRYFFPSSPAFLGLGIYGNIPLSSISSTGYTEEEQEAYDQVASSWSAEIQGIGTRVSFGAEIEPLTKLIAGLRMDVNGYWGWQQLDTSGWERHFSLKSDPIVYFGIKW
jgi:hypothetical protein